MKLIKVNYGIMVVIKFIMFIVDLYVKFLIVRLQTCNSNIQLCICILGCSDS